MTVKNVVADSLKNKNNNNNKTQKNKSLSTTNKRTKSVEMQMILYYIITLNSMLTAVNTTITFFFFTMSWEFKQLFTKRELTIT